MKPLCCQTGSSLKLSLFFSISNQSHAPRPAEHLSRRCVFRTSGLDESGFWLAEDSHRCNVASYLTEKTHESQKPHAPKRAMVQTYYYYLSLDMFAGANLLHINICITCFITRNSMTHQSLVASEELITCNLQQMCYTYLRQSLGVNL